MGGQHEKKNQRKGGEENVPKGNTTQESYMFPEEGKGILRCFG